MNKIDIIPAILEKTWEEVEKKIQQFAGIFQWIQIDVVALRCPTPNLGVGHLSGFEVDLMVDEPEKEAEKWIKAGVKRRFSI